MEKNECDFEDKGNHSYNICIKDQPNTIISIQLQLTAILRYFKQRILIQVVTELQKQQFSFDYINRLWLQN